MTEQIESESSRVDMIRAEYEGEEVEIWNEVSVYKDLGVHPNEIVGHVCILAGDGSTDERPDYITPAIWEQLRDIDVYPDVDVLDPNAEKVTVL